MNHVLTEHIYRADGRYFTDSELNLLTDFIHTYQTRLNAYAILSERANQFVKQAVQKLAQTDGHAVREHQEKCERDMEYVLRSIAVAILKNDEEGFKQHLILWMQNIMAALHKDTQSARAYKFLQDAIKSGVSEDCARLILDYLDEFIAALKVGVQ
jgi:hypothetical protein